MTLADSVSLRGRAPVLLGLGLAVVLLAGFATARLGVAGMAAAVEAIVQLARDSGPLGLLLFALAQTLVALVGMIPASLLGMAAGMVYGVGVGFCVAAVGTLLGGWTAFWLARSFLRPWITRMLARRPGGRLAGLDEAVRRDGWRLVCLLRASPVMPFAITSYTLGLTRVRRTDYVLGTLAALPALLGYVALGAVARDGVRGLMEPSRGWAQWAMLSAGAVATVVLTVHGGRLVSGSGLLTLGRPQAAMAAGGLAGRMAVLQRWLLPAMFLATGLPLAVCLAALTPPGQVADEPAHVFRAQALAHGQVVGHREQVPGIGGATWTVAGVNADPATMFAAFAPSGPNRSLTAEEWAARRAVPWTDTQPFMQISPLAVYAPFFYAPGAVGLAVAQRFGASPFQAIRAGRFVNAMSYGIMGLLALVLARRGQALLFCVLCFPMTVSLAGSMNQDGQIIAASVLGAALLTHPADRQAPWGGAAYWGGVAVLACVGIVKVPYAGLAALALLPLSGPDARPWRVRAVAVAAIVVPSLAWTTYAMAAVSGFTPLTAYTPGPLWPGDPATVFHGPDPAAQMKTLLAHPLKALTLPFETIGQDVWLYRQAIGVLGWLSLVLPSWLYGLWGAGIACAVAADLLAPSEVGAPPVRVGVAGLALLGLAAVAVVFAVYHSQYLAWTPVGATRIEGPTGRYFLPVVPLLAVGLPRLLGFWGRFNLFPVLAAVPVAAAVAGMVAVPGVILVNYYLR